MHPPGEEAQVDFFEVTVDEGGVRRKVWKFLMRLMYCGRDFIHLYDYGDRPCFLDGHVRAFAHFGGAAKRLIYDNLSAAVKRVLGLKERELTDRFKALCSHYLFEPCFARPGQGHDKGGVESRGKAIRLQHLTPILAGPDLDTLSAAALADVDRLWRQRQHSDGRPLSGLFEEERALLLPLPLAPFEPRCLEPVAVSHSSTVKVGRAVYSLPEGWARLDAEAWIGARDIRFCCRGQATLRSRQRPGGQRIEYRDYLKELARKPQAVRQVAPKLVAELGEPYRKLGALLEQTHGGRQAGRILAGVLGAIHDHGQAAVATALEEALAVGAFAAEGSGNLLTIRHHLPQRPKLAETVVPPALQAVQIESGRAADYDLLLAAVMFIICVWRIGVAIWPHSAVPVDHHGTDAGMIASLDRPREKHEFRLVKNMKRHLAPEAKHETVKIKHNLEALRRELGKPSPNWQSLGQACSNIAHKADDAIQLIDRIRTLDRRIRNFDLHELAQLRSYFDELPEPDRVKLRQQIILERKKIIEEHAVDRLADECEHRHQEFRRVMDSFGQATHYKDRNAAQQALNMAIPLEEQQKNDIRRLMHAEKLLLRLTRHKLREEKSA